MSAGCRGCLPGSGMSTGTGMTSGCRDVHRGWPEGARYPRAPRCRCSQGPAVSSRCRWRCRAAAGLWCHLVGCRLPAAPLCRGERVTPARVSPGLQAAQGSALRYRGALHPPLQPLLGQSSRYFSLLMLHRVPVLSLLGRAGAFRKCLSEQLVSQGMFPDPPAGRNGGLSSSSRRRADQQESLCPH